MSAERLVWLSHLAGEARRRVPVAIPRTVFVAHPQRRGASPPREPNPGPATLIGWLYRIAGEPDDPTHAEIRWPDGREGFCPAAMIHPANHVVPLSAAHQRQEAPHVTR
jgi:hypothetical protein